VKNWQKTISIDEKLNVISQLETGELIVDIFCDVRLAHSSVRTIHDNADRIKESAKSGTKEFVWVPRLPQFYQDEPCQNLCESLTVLLHYK
jgi:hypothetical protein